MQFNTIEKTHEDFDLPLFVSVDFCPAKGPISELLKGPTAKAVFSDFCEIIRETDLSITNLGCPLTSSNYGIEKIGPNLKAPPEIASMLKFAGFDLVTLANYHIYDYGQEGLSETLDSLQRHSLSYVGAGLSLRDAQKTFFIEIKAIKLSIVNFAEVEFYCADSERGGANPMELIANVHQIQEARKNSDHVLVIIHGGHEQYHYPSPATIKRYQFYAESGASSVIAYHSHCIEGYEKYNGVPIFYSLGNFFFPIHKTMPDSWYEGYALLLKIKKDALTFEILPYEQCKNKRLAIDRTQGVEILKEIETISNIIRDDKQIAINWKQFTKKKRC